MVGIITHLEAGYDYTTMPLHPDDATSLSKVYPVAMPLAGSSKLPLINVSARFEGQLLDPTGAAGVFGRNVWLEVENGAGTPVGWPIHGGITGTARLDVLDTALANGAGPYISPSVVLPYFASPSVVGSTGGTADFTIDGAFAGTLAQPINYEVVFEDGGALGVTNGNLAEWYQEVGLYQGNPIPGTATYGSHVLRSFMSPYGPTFSSMQVVAGSVVVLDPLDHYEALFTGAFGGPTTVIAEVKSRPVVDAAPRNGRFTATSVTLTAVPSPGVPIDVATAQLWVNGVNQTALLPAPTFAGATATWTIPMATLTALVGGNPNTPLNVSFLARDLLPFPYQPLAAWGRNDVVL